MRKTRFSRGSRSGGGAATIVAALLVACSASAGELDPQSAQMLDHALQQLQDLRDNAASLQYDAKLHLTERDGKGRLRGSANAVMTVRPGETNPITYVSREVHGKVRLPGSDNSKDEAKDDVTLQQFARDHRIHERFDFSVTTPDAVTAGTARRIDFAPKPNQREKNTADRFLDAIEGSAWLTEGSDRLAKFEMRLRQPFQLFWIFAVLKELSIDYDLLEPNEFPGHARVKVAFWLASPIYTLRQEHDIEVDHFRRRELVMAGK
ncbi:MAG: hypothetical protein ACJ8KU_00970 [Chthoniobacterales bacterium]